MFLSEGLNTVCGVDIKIYILAVLGSKQGPQIVELIFKNYFSIPKTDFMYWDAYFFTVSTSAVATLATSDMIVMNNNRSDYNDISIFI